MGTVFGSIRIPYNSTNGLRVGEKFTRFPLGAYHFGVLICYEDTDPFLARHYGTEGTDGPAVDFLLNISNDLAGSDVATWQPTPPTAPGHPVASERFCGRRQPLARAVNMGISAVIDSNGRVQQPQETAEGGDVKMWLVQADRASEIPDLPEGKWHDFTKVHGVLTATIPIDNRLSLYAWTGDWLPGGCWLLLGGVWLWRRGQRGCPKRGQDP